MSKTQAPRYAKSSRAFVRAKKLLPGGVNSPVRAYRSVGRDPIFITRGRGAFVTDLDGRRYVDYVGSYGPLILGHAHPTVIKAIAQAARRGISFGMPTQAESELAEMVIDALPSIEKVRFVNSGTEATMSAIRLARAVTGRSRIVKCTGGYHGHADALLAEAGSGAATCGVPGSAGVPTTAIADTLLVPFNDLAAMTKLFAQQGEKIACIAIEPIAGNMGCVPPAPGYLQGLRRLATRHGALLLFDEVMTGFRVAYGGAQTLYGVKPDITCLGKVIGGGLPCAAYGASREIMSFVAPDGPMYQAGTLSGNPLAMAAGLATLRLLRDGKAYRQLERTSARLARGLDAAARSAGIAVHLARVGSMICPFFHAGPVRNYEDARHSDTKAFTTFFGAMIDARIVLPPSQYETWFVSTAHDDRVIDRTIDAAATAFEAVRD